MLVRFRFHRCSFTFFMVVLRLLLVELVLLWIRVKIWSPRKAAGSGTTCGSTFCRRRIGTARRAEGAVRWSARALIGCGTISPSAMRWSFPVFCWVGYFLCFRMRFLVVSRVPVALNRWSCKRNLFLKQAQFKMFGRFVLIRINVCLLVIFSNDFPFEFSYRRKGIFRFYLSFFSVKLVIFRKL